MPQVLLIVVAILLTLAPSQAALASAVIHDVDDVFENYTFEQDGKLYFALPSAPAWEMITDTSDPEILNKGDGAFHPFRAEIVAEALAEVSYDLSDVPFQVFILPYPRRGLVESFASPGKVFLSPGVLEYLPQLTHFTIVHELGHIIHRCFMPDDSPLWKRYREIRRITDTSTYNNTAIHRNRPTEIFAEDFRFLFGGALANYSGSIENGSLPLPTQVPGLREFFLSLPVAAQEVAKLRMASFPNPFNPVLNVNFSVSAEQIGERATLRIFDVHGRLVRTLLDREVTAGNHSLVWAGDDEQGRTVTSGIYFLKLQVGAESISKKVIMSR